MAKGKGKKISILLDRNPKKVLLFYYSNFLHSLGAWHIGCDLSKEPRGEGNHTNQKQDAYGSNDSVCGRALYGTLCVLEFDALTLKLYLNLRKFSSLSVELFEAALMICIHLEYR
jgi:hypothetical protein